MDDDLKYLPVSEWAKRLDEDKPGWYQLIDFGDLNLYSLDRCVLGQVYAEEAARVGPLYGGFSVGTRRLQIPGYIPKAFSSGTKHRWLIEVIRRKRKQARFDKLVGKAADRFIAEYLKWGTWPPVHELSAEERRARVLHPSNYTVDAGT